MWPDVKQNHGRKPKTHRNLEPILRAKVTLNCSGEDRGSGDVLEYHAYRHMAQQEEGEKWDRPWGLRL